MKLSFMRNVDELVGYPLCRAAAFFIALKHLFSRRERTLDEDGVKLIVIQKFFGMGSLIHAIPLIRALKDRFPRAKVVLATYPPMVSLAELSGVIDEIVVFPDDSFIKFASCIFRTAVRAMSRPADISIDLEFFSKFTLLMSVVTGARIRVGLYQPKIRPAGIITHRVYYNHHRHLSEIYFAFASEALHIPPRREFFQDLLPLIEDETKRRVAAKFGLESDRKLIIINPNSSDLFVFRRWPMDYFAELIKMLLDRYPEHQYLVIGAAKEADYAEEIINSVPDGAGKLINAAGRTSIRELCVLLGSASLLITNDSGPLHIASAYGVNIAAFFGPETPELYGPLNDNSLVFYSHKNYCSPCLSVFDGKKSVYRDDCKTNKCLTEFKPDQVFEAIERRFLRDDAQV